MRNLRVWWMGGLSPDAQLSARVVDGGFSRPMRSSRRVWLCVDPTVNSGFHVAGGGCQGDLPEPTAQILPVPAAAAAPFLLPLAFTLRSLNALIPLLGSLRILGQSTRAVPPPETRESCRKSTPPTPHPVLALTAPKHRAGRHARAIKTVRRAGWEWAASCAPAAKSCLG